MNKSPTPPVINEPPNATTTTTTTAAGAGAAPATNDLTAREKKSLALINKSGKGTNINEDAVSMDRSPRPLARRFTFQSENSEKFIGSRCLLSSTSGSTTDDDYKYLAQHPPVAVLKKAHSQVLMEMPVSCPDISESSSEEDEDDGLWKNPPKKSNKKSRRNEDLIEQDLEYNEILPNITYKHVSKEELNTPEEIRFIENNVAQNNLLLDLNMHIEDRSFKELSSESILSITYPRSCFADVEDNQD